MVKSPFRVPKADELSLYFHIPFCTHKCHYCHFYVVPDKESYKDQLLEDFKLEWKLRLNEIQNRTIVSVYFGGGTPYLFGPARIAEVLRFIREQNLSPDAEITLEANPENVQTKEICEYANAGINRVSLGVQSLSPEHLATLSRLHSADKAIESIMIVKDAGISNISIDLMYDLPNQTVDDWKKTLDLALTLPITHISLYNLTIEPHTVFYKYREKIRPNLPSDEESTAMYKIANEKLCAAGFDHYEISAYAKNGMIARHNIGYWIGREFLGFGPSAFSYMKRQRFSNIANLHRYSKLLRAGQLPIDYLEELDSDERRRELLAVNLRVLSGVDLNEFQVLNGPLEKETEKVLRNLQEQDFLILQDSVLNLTEHGVLFYDTIASEII